MTKIAVIGGGINGAGIAWELARRGYEVEIFDKGGFGAQTSSATTKMIHGGIRYLETFDFRLVREALRERAFLLDRVPDLVHPLEIILPFYRNLARPRWMLDAGLTLYDLLAGRRRIASHRHLSTEEVEAVLPLRDEALEGGFSFYDAQVDDHALTERVIAAARRDGAIAHEFNPIEEVRRTDGGWSVRHRDGVAVFDAIVNACGPWMNEFLEKNAIPSAYTLQLVRGSHIVIDRPAASAGVLLQSPSDGRILFVLPWKDLTLIGTTEVYHRGPLDDVRPSEEEIDYLLDQFSRYVEPPATRSEIVEAFAGVRPLIGRGDRPGAITREYRIERGERLVNVFGGKMTTFMSLARKVGAAVDRVFGVRTEAAEPVF